MRVDPRIPPWDEPVHGYDAESIGEHFLHRYFPQLFDDPDHAKISAVIKSLEGMLREALEYGAGQVRYKFLYPHRCYVFLQESPGVRRCVGEYCECRFCQARGLIGFPDSITHAPNCMLLVPSQRAEIIEAGSRCTIEKR